MKRTLARIAGALPLAIIFCAPHATGQSDASPDPILQDLSEKLDNTIDAATTDLALVSDWLRDMARIWFDSATSIGGDPGLEGVASELIGHSKTLDPSGENKDVLRFAAFVMNEEQVNRARQIELFATVMDMGQQLSGQSDLEWRWQMDLPTGSTLRQLQGPEGRDAMRGISSALKAITDRSDFLLGLEDTLSSVRSLVQEARKTVSEIEEEQERVLSNLKAVCCVLCRSMSDLTDSYSWATGLYDAGENFINKGALSLNEEIGLSEGRRVYQACFRVNDFDHIVLDRRPIPSSEERRPDLATLEIADAEDEFWNQLGANQIATIKRTAMLVAVREVRSNIDANRSTYETYDRAQDSVRLGDAFAAHVSDETIMEAIAAKEAVSRVWGAWATIQDTAARMEARGKALDALRN